MVGLPHDHLLRTWIRRNDLVFRPQLAAGYVWSTVAKDGRPDGDFMIGVFKQMHVNCLMELFDKDVATHHERSLVDPFQEYGLT